MDGVFIFNLCKGGRCAPCCNTGTLLFIKNVTGKADCRIWVGVRCNIPFSSISALVCWKAGLRIRSVALDLTTLSSGVTVGSGSPSMFCEHQ